MKSTRIMLAAVATLVIFATSAHAIPYADLDLIGIKLDASTPLNSVYSGEFDIGQWGYNKDSQKVDSASVSFIFSDNVAPWKDDASETVNIDLGSSLYLGPIEINFPTSVNGGVLGTVLADLQDGKLKYTINAKSGDFIVVSAALLVDASPRPRNSVPDGGATAALLGLGLLGLSAVGRKLRS